MFGFDVSGALPSLCRELLDNDPEANTALELVKAEEPKPEPAEIAPPIERKAHRHLVGYMLAHGYRITVNDGGEHDAVINSRDEAEIIKAIEAVEDSSLYISKEGAIYSHWARVIFGNEDHELVADMSDDSLMDTWDATYRKDALGR